MKTIVIPDKDDYITTQSALNILGRQICLRHFQRMCERGTFKTAYKPGYGKRGRWRVLRSEVIAHRMNGHYDPYS